MEIKTFSQMFNDKHFTDYKKMKYKYSENFNEFLQTLNEFYYTTLPLSDFYGNNIVFIENQIKINQNPIKLLLQPQNKHYSIKVAEDEIMATTAIEKIDFSRDSVRNILKGMAPNDEQENRILGIKRGLEFIADTTNKITEENLYKLYMMTVGNFLSDNDKLAKGNLYRHDTVYVVSDRIEHSGLEFEKVPRFMKSLIDFATANDDINDLIKAAIIHFYIAYVHPYFDGNGRMARLVHLWFLIQKGYHSTLFIPFSSQIKKTCKSYYAAFTSIEYNRKYSGKIDLTPFVLYFVNNVYNQINKDSNISETMDIYNKAVKKGKITEKETNLWKFVISYYGTDEFSTKQLEKDFSDAAYATIRSFVLKFKDLGLLSVVKYGVRIKYKIIK